MTTLEQARRFLARRLGIEENVLQTLAALGLAPAARRQLFVDAEREFGIRFSKELGEVGTVEDFIAAVAWELAQQRASAESKR